jgi:hypothetical protein
MAKPRIAIFGPATYLGAPDYDRLTAEAMVDRVKQRATTAGLEPVPGLPTALDILLRYAGSLEAGATQAENDEKIFKALRRDYPSTDLFVLSGLKRVDPDDTPEGDVIIESSMARLDPNGVLQIERFDEKLEGFRGMEMPTSALDGVSERIANKFSFAALAPTDGTGGGATDGGAGTTDGAGGASPDCPPPREVVREVPRDVVREVVREVERPRPTWHIPTAVGVGVAGGVLLGLLIAAALKKSTAPTA